MPADEVFAYVKSRLRTEPAKSETAKPQSQKPEKKTKATTPEAKATLSKMKGRYADVLMGFWNGTLALPDTLNHGIRLLALMLPYYLADEDQAVELIEQYIDELPDDGFSDRLSDGNRGEVSRIVRATVKKVYDGNQGQPDPELSRQKLDLTYQAWKKRGFDPTDKTTWKKGSKCVLAKPFSWTCAEIKKLAVVQDILKVDLNVASKVVKYVLRFLKVHSGEFAINYLKAILKDFGIQCDGHHGKANKLLRLLQAWKWIYVRNRELWHSVDENGVKRQGRARAYGIGEQMQQKFESKRRATGAGRPAGVLHTTPPPHMYLCIVSHPFSPETAFSPSKDIFSSEIPLHNKASP
jgi:hypothetical protein